MGQCPARFRLHDLRMRKLSGKYVRQTARKTYGGITMTAEPISAEKLFRKCVEYAHHKSIAVSIIKARDAQLASRGADGVTE